MARIVETLQDEVDSDDYGRFSIYPWVEWTDGNIREVQHDEDFTVSLQTFRVYLYQWKEMMNQGKAPTPDVSTVVANRWRDPVFQRKMATLGCNTVVKAKKYYAGRDDFVWAVHTRIVAPGVIRFYFEPDDQ